jgi:hypothetical protein
VTILLRPALHFLNLRAQYTWQRRLDKLVLSRTKCSAFCVCLSPVYPQWNITNAVCNHAWLGIYPISLSNKNTSSSFQTTTNTINVTIFYPRTIPSGHYASVDLVRSVRWELLEEQFQHPSPRMPTYNCASFIQGVLQFKRTDRHSFSLECFSV